MPPSDPNLSITDAFYRQRMAIADAFHEAVIDRGEKVQICLAGCPPVGPGRATLVGAPGTYIYKMIVEAQVGPGAPVFKFPITFSATDLIWFSDGKGPGETESNIVMPFGNEAS